MLGRTIFFAAGVCGFVALFAPTFSTDVPEDGGPGSSSHASARLQARNQIDANWYAGAQTLNRNFDGHFYANAAVNGVPVHMMVDTGASVIALTGSDAMDAGLDWNERDIHRVGTGASGAVYGVEVVLAEVDIGGMTRRNVSAVIIPEGLAVSLLGQSFLSQVGSVQISGDEMILATQ